jgi:hypothetical protein
MPHFYKGYDKYLDLTEDEYWEQQAENYAGEEEPREKIKLQFKQCSKCGHKPGQASEDYPCQHTWVGGEKN